MEIDEVRQAQRQLAESNLKLFANSEWTKREPGMINYVMCLAEKKPEPRWILSKDWALFKRLTRLYTRSGVIYFGYPLTNE